MFSHINVWVRGAGELGSATAHILHQSGFPTILSDLLPPLAIRRTVTFSDALITGAMEVEDVKAVKCDPEKMARIQAEGHIPIVIDDRIVPRKVKPHVYVDARMLKKVVANPCDKNTFVIGLGPGFTAGENCDVVIETHRGHDLGKIIRNGSPRENTGIPGVLGGETIRRVIYAPASGNIEWNLEIGSRITRGDALGTIDKKTVIRAPLTGLVRGLISPLVPVRKGLKIADIDPRGSDVDFRTISDKSRLVGRGVLEAILIHLNSKAGHNT